MSGGLFASISSLTLGLLELRRGLVRVSGEGSDLSICPTNFDTVQPLPVTRPCWLSADGHLRPQIPVCEPISPPVWREGLRGSLQVQGPGEWAATEYWIVCSGFSTAPPMFRSATRVVASASKASKVSAEGLRTSVPEGSISGHPASNVGSPAMSRGPPADEQAVPGSTSGCSASPTPALTDPAAD